MNIRVFWVAEHVAYSASPHMHDFFHLILCKAPGGKVSVNNQTYFPTKDQVYFVKPTTPHSINKGNDMKLIEIKFLVEEPLLAKLADVPDTFSLKDKPFLCGLLEKVAAEGLSTALYADDAANSAMKLFLVQIAREFDKNSPPLDESVIASASLDSSPTIESDDNDILILKLRGYIESNLSKDITLEHLSELVFFNKTYFVKRFKLLWGTTPMRFVNQIRIEHSRGLLSSTNQSISSIAEECGFKSIHYFSRAFKKETGYSPIEYRRRAAKKQKR